MLLDWLAGAGAVVDRLLLAHDGEHGRGMVAREDLAEGERVLVIPRRCMLVVDRADDPDAGEMLDAAGIEPSSHAALAACLLRERDDPRSFWRPYLDALPRAFPSVPLHYGEDELALLRGSYLVDRIAARRAALRFDFEALRAGGVLAGGAFDAFVWASLVVSSRAFGVTVAGRKTLALVPAADMLNHRIPPDVRWGYEDERDAFVMTAARNIRAGEPVHDSYGPKCNARFLLSYGFVLDDNPDNEASVRLSVPRDAPGFEAKLRLLGAASRSFLVSARLAADSTREALAFLRIAHASEAELRAAPARGAGEIPLGPRNEARALAALAAACTEALGRFPTTLDEDEALLQGGGLGPAARDGVRMRRGEKRVLVRLRAAAERRGP